MSRYAKLEISAFGIVAALLSFMFSENLIAVYGAVVATYTILQIVSALAFCVAIHKGLVREHIPAPYKYSVTPECAKDWLVMRHLWTYLRLADLQGKS